MNKSTHYLIMAFVWSLLALVYAKKYEIEIIDAMNMYVYGIAVSYYFTLYLQAKKEMRDKK